jgi:hypothetical protein
MTFYRIAWRSLLTGIHGHGEFIFPVKKDVEEYIEELNRKYIGEITHWVESSELASAT